MIATSNPVPQFFDLDGNPLEGGKIYYGIIDLQPDSNPITVYWDVAGTQPAIQPISTIAGYAVNTGTPANIFTNQDYSILVKDATDQTVLYIPRATQFGNAGQIGAVVGLGQTVTINVPSQYDDIDDAIDAIKDWVILGTVKIQVADGTYNLTKTQYVNHPFGKNIQILGNVTDPTLCVLRGANPPTFDAIVCNNGNNIGLINGFTIDLTAKATLSNNYTAILAESGANIILGNKIEVNNWYYGIAARNGSYIFADYAKVDNAGDVGIWSFVGSTVQARNAESNNTIDNDNDYGFGFQAEYGSTMDCSYSSATGCKMAGFAALSNSTLRALNTTSSSNLGSGYYSAANSMIENHNSVGNNNGQYGTRRYLNGNILGSGSTYTGNTDGAYSGYVYIDNNASLGARIGANGHLRIDNDGTGNTYFNTSGGLQLEIRHTDTAVGRWYVQGAGAANANQCTFGTDGAESTINGRFQLKGSAELFFNNGNGLQAMIGNTASAANYLCLRAGTTGNPAFIEARGSDAVVDLALYPKGVGSYVRLGAGYDVLAGEEIAGYLTIRDNDGNLRKIAVVE